MYGDCARTNVSGSPNGTIAVLSNFLVLVNEALCFAILAAVVCGSESAGSQEVQSARLCFSTSQDDMVARCIQESGHPADFVETRYVDETPMPSLRPEEEGRGYVVFRRYWMDLVFPNSIPKRGEITEKLEAFVSRGEYEPVTFCVRAVRELKGLDVKAGELVSAGGDRLAAPEVRIVRCSPRMSPGNADYGRGPLYEGGPIGVMEMPTYLEEARAADVAAGTTVQYWLTMHVDADAGAGVYQGDIEITQEGGSAHTLSLTVQVSPVTLLEATVALGFWDFQEEPYGGEIGTVAEVYETMQRHGMNAVVTHVGLWHWDSGRDFSEHIAIGEDGRVRVTVEGSPLAARMEAAKRAGFRAVGYQPRFGFRGGFVGEVVSKRVARETLDQETSRELARVLGRYEGSEHYDLIKKETTNAAETYFPMFSEAYGTLYVQILREILEEGRRRGWPEILVSPGDERFSHHRKKHQRGEMGKALPLAVRELELMKRAGATTIMNQLSPFMRQRKWSWFGDYAREAARFVDIAMPGLRPSYTTIPGPLDEGVEKVVQGLGEWGVATYTYNVTISGMPDLTAARFNAGYLFETLGRGVEGEFDYIFFRPEGNAYNPLDGYDFMWYFPPREETGRLGGPALWLAAKREGVDDLRHLQTLDALIDEAQARTDSPGAQDAARAAAATRERILGSFDFDAFKDAARLSECRSRWDAVIASPGVEPVVKGACRLPNGWDFETYDRSRRDMAEAIIKLQQALAQ